MLGVYILFVITGFLSVMGIEKRDAIEYVIKRFARIYPCYFVAIIITSLVLITIPSITPSIKQILANFTMVQKLFGIEGVDGVYWTLSIQLLFWFFIATVIFLKKCKRMTLFLFLWQTISIIVAIIEKFNSGSVIKMLTLIISSDYISLLLTGAMLGLLYNGSVRLRLVTIIVIMGTFNQSIAMGKEKTLIYLLAVFLMLIVAKGYDIRETNLSIFFGKFASISYPFYLVHCKIGYAILQPFLKRGFDGEIWLFVPFVITILLAIVMHVIVEEPSNKIIIDLFIKRTK